MNISVKLYGLLRPHHPGPNRSLPIPLVIAEGATVAQAVLALNLPPELARVAAVNGEQTDLNTTLHEGDQVMLMSILVGG
ncbi:MAG: MoaD/ThiS family protein [Anaerolineae bacterium]|nr:MoaD/ThiS family protein [Anaerolineae bacterium]